MAPKWEINIGLESSLDWMEGHLQQSSTCKIQHLQSHRPVSYSDRPNADKQSFSAVKWTCILPIFRADLPSHNLQLLAMLVELHPKSSTIFEDWCTTPDITRKSVKSGLPLSSCYGVQRSLFCFFTDSKQNAALFCLFSFCFHPRSELPEWLFWGVFCGIFTDYWI